MLKQASIGLIFPMTTSLPLKLESVELRNSGTKLDLLELKFWRKIGSNIDFYQY